MYNLSMKKNNPVESKRISQWQKQAYPPFSFDRILGGKHVSP